MRAALVDLAGRFGFVVKLVAREPGHPVDQGEFGRRRQEQIRAGLVADPHTDRVGCADREVALERRTGIADALFPVDLSQNRDQMFDGESFRTLKLHPNLIAFHLQ